MTQNSDLLLREAKLRRTPVRVGVIGALQAAKTPLSAADILPELPPGADLLTVYRTLAIHMTLIARRIRDKRSMG